jgi:uncharacterized protein YndB with AHSA1/START domain
VSETSAEISWPEELRPEVAAFHAVNELQIDAAREHVWEWLRRPELWPGYYGNCRFVKHLGGAWPQAEVGTGFRWFTFGVFVISEVVECRALEGRIAWSASELGAHGHHAWVLSDRDGGTFVRTEETQRGWGVAAVKPVLSRLMVRQHQRWLEGLARVAAQGPPPPPGAERSDR